MQRETEISLIKEVLNLNEQNTTQFGKASLGQTVDRYIDPSFFEKEKERIFTKIPNAVAVTGEIPNPGDYLAKQWINEIPLLLARDHEGKIRAYANICKHRNSTLVAVGTGCKQKFTCPYHGWTYGLDGKLKGAPDFDAGFAGLSKDDVGLLEFSAKEVNGMIFVSIDPTTPIPENYIPNEVINSLDYLKVSKQKVYKSREYLVKANWKIIAEGGYEAYHYNVAHKGSLAPFFQGNRLTWQSWDRFMRMVLPKKSMFGAIDLPEEQWDIRQMSNLLYTFPPFMSLLAQPDNISVIRAIPLSPHETRIEEVLLVDAPRDGGSQWSPEELGLHEKNFNLVNHILWEDWTLMENIQSNMKSGLVKHVNFGRFEAALTEMHEQYERDLGI